MPICSNPPKGITFNLPFPSFFVPRALRFTGRAAAVSSVFFKGAGTCLLPAPCPCLGAGVRRLGARLACSFFSAASGAPSVCTVLSAPSAFLPSSDVFFGLAVLL